MFRLFNKELNAGDVLFPANSFADIRLADLPRSAKRPRFYIKEARFAQMPKDKFDAVYANSAPLEKGYTYVRFCLTYHYGPREEEDCVCSHAQFQYQVTPAELRQIKRGTKKLYLENVNEHVTFINGIAKGESPTQYKIIKNILNEKKRG